MITEEDFRQSVINLRERTDNLDHAGGYWTDYEKKKLKRMFYDGIGITEIAITLQRTERAVSQQIEHMYLYSRNGYPLRQRNHRSCKCKCNNCAMSVSECPQHIPYDERRVRKEQK